MGASPKWRGKTPGLNCGSFRRSARLAHAGEPPVQRATRLANPTARQLRRTQGAIRPLPKPADGPIVRRSPRADPGPFILRYCNGVVDEATEVRSLTISPPHRRTVPYDGSRRLTGRAPVSE